MSIPQTRGNPLRQCGVTLIEQIAVLAIISVLIGLSVPPLARLLSRNQVQLAQTDFIAALQYARSTAAISGRRTVLCPSTDGLLCSDNPRWETGWLVRHDDSPNQPPLRRGDGYRGVTILGDNGRRLVRFQNDGSAGGMTNTLRFCRRGQADQALVVVISNSGRIRGATASPEQAASCAEAR